MKTISLNYAELRFNMANQDQEIVPAWMMDEVHLCLIAVTSMILFLGHPTFEGAAALEFSISYSLPPSSPNSIYHLPYEKA